MKLIRILLVAAALAVTAVAALYVFAPVQFTDAAMGLERSLAGLQRREIDVEGLHIVYLDSGGSGAPLVLVHGFGADKDNWTKVARFLSRRYRVIAPDLPGYGESSSPATIGYGIDEQVQRLHGFVGAIGLTRADFGGSSMGGQIVARYATRYPNEVASLWLVANAGVTSAPRSELFERVEKGGPNPLIPTSVEQFRDLMNFVFTQPPFIPEPVIQVLGTRAVATQALRRKQFQELVGVPSQLEKQLAGLPTPTHILWGSRDRALDAGAVSILSGLLPNSSATVLAGLGHLPMIEAPAESAADYIAFRDRLAAPSH